MKLRDLITESNEDIEKAKEWIIKNFTETKVARMIDEEIINWVDEDWEEEGFDSEFDWYSEYGHGEAEDEIVNEIIRQATVVIKTKLNVSEKLKLDKWIREEYNLSS